MSELTSVDPTATAAADETTVAESNTETTVAESNAETTVAAVPAEEAADSTAAIDQGTPVDLLAELKAEIERVVATVLPAYASNERAQAKHAEVTKDVADATEASTSGDGELHKFFASVLRAHKL